LRDNGATPVEFYACPADTRFPSDIVRQTFRRSVGWLTKYLH
jgi:hypothetical protein